MVTELLLALGMGRRAPSPDALVDFLAAFHDERLLVGRPSSGAGVVPESAALGGRHRVNVDLIQRGVMPDHPSVATLDLDATILESRRRDALPHHEGGRVTSMDELGNQIAPGRTE